MEINRYHIFCNTALRSSGTTSDFTIALNPALTKTDPHSYFTAQIVSVEIPYSWNQVNSTNNTLQIAYTVNGGTTINYTISLTAGNYTVNTLMSQLATQIEAAVPTHSWSHNMVYNNDTNKITFGIKNASAYTSIVLAINFPANQFLARMFGSLNATNIVYGYAATVYQNVSSSTNVNVNPVSSIYIRSSNLRQVKNQENLVTGYSQDPSDILCKLQIYTPPKSWIFYNGELGLSARLVNPVIDKLDMYLSDNYSFSLKMENNDWSFRITFIEYIPYNLGDGYQMTKHLNGHFNNQPGTINDLINEDIATPAESKPVAQQDTMRVKKFQRE